MYDQRVPRTTSSMAALVSWSSTLVINTVSPIIFGNWSLSATRPTESETGD